MSTTASLRVVSPRRPLGTRIVDLWRFRELLVGMVRTQLKVKYKNSFLGFFWSMLNPALYLVVFYVVFVIVFRSQQPLFPIFLLSGLLVWNLFSTGLSGATGSIVANGSIVKKVAFPREILPLASVGAALVHFFLQSIVLVGALAVFRYEISWSYLTLLPFALVVLLLFSAALGIFLSAANVYLRDTQHFLELLLLAWFWFTPIVWPFKTITEGNENLEPLFMVNPITDIVLIFQRALYNKTSYVNNEGKTIELLPAEGLAWYGARVAIVGVVAAVLFIGALAFFGKAEGNFAEEL